ncbi:MAG: DUF1287 domain-containing protein [Akkermansiaceae bacterium]|jgi:uncharacterized protein|nr:DUF1287 domain-containing protein [Akkermansiaceae bacterium]MDP4647399.1 DUF1287 domain-containing protein [Akkermansiaceae bacterium]MDP4722136.1 DUF1287 domain-containing protein [Akkermansiaceae bacterium]MDP4781544.1 DUF1287 domain-containing protein [Akkermansiaceae bacterium]MDP4848005.1 DUF1287 domain-containing protein [Akkermansiaceae bacterium]
MARSRSGYYSAIEYIGPRPQKPKKPNLFGGWVIVAIAAGACIFFGKPLVTKALASDDDPTKAENQVIIQQLASSQDFGSKLAAEALRYSGSDISYDPSYYKITYPGGDVPAGKGVAADLVVRSYRSLGIDLQEKVHEDMEANFRVYPQLWAATGTDENIDHRRVPNLQRFFSREGQELSASRHSEDYKVGDIVVWALSNAETHIGIVVPGPASEGSAPWVAHHPAGGGVKWENALFSYQIVGHFRYPAE